MTGITREERAAIAETFGSILADYCTEAQLRAAMATPSGKDEALWQQLGESGFLALLAPAEFGGIGAGPLELEAVMERAGEALVGSPFFSTAVLAVGLLAASTDSAAQARLLPALATGEKTATVALTGDAGTWLDRDVAVTATADGQLDGVASYVTDGQHADVLLVVARGPEGLGAYEVTDRTGLTIADQPCIDRTFRLARLSFAGVRAVKVADAAAVAQMQRLALLARVSGQTGAARRIFQITIEYIGQRVQFGRVVGSFQALKHMAADLLIELESMISVSREAAAALAEGRGDAAELLAMAGFSCTESFNRITHDAMQMHGGIAFTSEYVCHLYLRRARATAQLLGSSPIHKESFIAIREKAA